MKVSSRMVNLTDMEFTNLNPIPSFTAVNLKMAEEMEWDLCTH